MVNRYMPSQEESVSTSDDLAAMQTVFDALKVHAASRGRPETLHTLARSDVALRVLANFWSGRLQSHASDSTASSMDEAKS